MAPQPGSRRRARWSPTCCRPGSSSCRPAPDGSAASGITVTCPVSPVAQGTIRDRLVHGANHIGGGGDEGSRTPRAFAIRALFFFFFFFFFCLAIPDLNPSDNTDHAAVVVNPQADLSLTKTVSSANPSTDDEVQYTLTAHNAGPNDATGVTIVDSPTGRSRLHRRLTRMRQQEWHGHLSRRHDREWRQRLDQRIRMETTDPSRWARLSPISRRCRATTSTRSPATTRRARQSKSKPLVDLKLTKVASNPAPAAGGPVSYTLTLVNHGPEPRDRCDNHRPPSERALVHLEPPAVRVVAAPRGRA